MRSDRAVFEKQFYPLGKNPWIPASVLNRAVKKLPVEKYELIKAWVLTIKNERQFGSPEEVSVKDVSSVEQLELFEEEAEDYPNDCRF